MGRHFEHVTLGVCTWSRYGGGVPGPRGVYLVRYSPSPVDRMTQTYENITLPQTSFAGGTKNITLCKLHMGTVITLIQL